MKDVLQHHTATIAYLLCNSLSAHVDYSLNYRLLLFGSNCTKFLQPISYTLLHASLQETLPSCITIWSLLPFQREFISFHVHTGIMEKYQECSVSQKFTHRWVKNCFWHSIKGLTQFPGLPLKGYINFLVVHIKDTSILRCSI